MTWTYTSDPSTSARDAVRFLVGDTDHTDELVQDEEIAWALTEETNVYRAAARVTRTIAARFSRQVSYAIGDLREQLSDRQGHFRELAKELDRKATLRAARAYAGGISESDKQVEREDTDRVKPDFARGMHDHPDTFHNPEHRDLDEDDLA